MVLASLMVTIGVEGGLPRSCPTGTLCAYRWATGRKDM